MKFDHLKSFHRVAVTRSFTRTAQELFLTQPAVSQQIQLLEHRLGIKLFDRMGKMVGLTSEGEILLSYTERLFRINDEIEIHFGKLRDLETGKITVGSTAVIGTYFLPRIIGDYNRKYPLGESSTLVCSNASILMDLIFPLTIIYSLKRKKYSLQQQKLL